MEVISNLHEHYPINYSKTFLDNNCETNYYRSNWSQNGFSFPLCQQNSVNLIHCLSDKSLKKNEKCKESQLWKHSDQMINLALTELWMFYLPSKFRTIKNKTKQSWCDSNTFSCPPAPLPWPVRIQEYHSLS